MSVEYTGLRELEDDLYRAAAEFPETASAVTRKSGLDIVAHAQQHVPVDTGATKNSIDMDVLEDTSQAVEVQAGPETEYSPYLEEGTSKMSPRPFMGPAWDEVEPIWEEAIGQAATNPLGGK